MDNGVKENVGEVQEVGDAGRCGHRPLRDPTGEPLAEGDVGEQVLWQLMAIGFADVCSHMAVEDGALVVRDTETLSPFQAAAVASIEKTASGVKLKFYDKLKALELLGRHYGLFEPGAPSVTENNLLSVLLRRTREEMDLCDIPELQQAAEPCHDLVEPGESANL